MSSYIEVHAQINGRDVPSKRALKLTLADHPERVTFRTVSPFNTPQVWTGATLPELTDAVVLQVTGPNPFTDRRYYASLTRNAKTGAPRLT